MVTDGLISGNELLFKLSEKFKIDASSKSKEDLNLPKSDEFLKFED